MFMREKQYPYMKLRNEQCESPENRVLIIVPAYNECENILGTIKNIKENCPNYECVVINDGSNDKTGEICESNGINVISLPINMGLSAAFRTGMKYAFFNGYHYAIQIDGDGQHRPEYIHKMYEMAINNEIDILIGSRYTKRKKNGSIRGIGNALISLCIKITTRQRLTDATSGMRLYNKRMIELFKQNSNLYPEPDTIAYLIRCGAKVDEYPVIMNERKNGQSYLNPLRSIQYMFDTCVSVIIMQWFRRKKGIL